MKVSLGLEYNNPFGQAGEYFPGTDLIIRRGYWADETILPLSAGEEAPVQRCPILYVEGQPETLVASDVVPGGWNDNGLSDYDREQWWRSDHALHGLGSTMEQITGRLRKGNNMDLDEQLCDRELYKAIRADSALLRAEPAQLSRQRMKEMLQFTPLGGALPMSIREYATVWQHWNTLEGRHSWRSALYDLLEESQ